MAVWASCRSALRAGVLFVLPTLVLCTAALEVGLRLLGRLPSNTTDGIFALRGKSYGLRPDMTKVSITPSFTCTIHTDDWGFRDRAPGPRALGPGPYFAIMGDSLTFGNGVDYDQSFIGVFAGLARSKGIETLNMAVGGHRLTDQEEQLDAFLARAPQKPAEVVVVVTAPLAAMFELRFTDLVVKNGYLFPRSNWIVPYATVMLGNTSSAYSFFRDNIRKAQQRFFPSGPKTALELMDIFGNRYPAAQPDASARLDARLTALEGRIRAAGGKTAYVYLPSSADLRWRELLAAAGEKPEDYDFSRWRDLLRRHAERAGLTFVDLTPVLQREAEKGVPLSFAQDMHYTAASSAVIGQALYDGLLGDGAAAGGDH